ncbi:MAG: RNA recognition motif domain-containing protein [Candidatus Binataceae bacterium]
MNDDTSIGARLFVGNLNFKMDDNALREMVGRITSVMPENVARAEIMRDRESGHSRGFGFVELASADEARRALSELDGTEVMGRRLRVQMAKPRINAMRRHTI